MRAKPSAERVRAVDGSDATALVSPVGAGILSFVAGGIESIQRVPLGAQPPMSAGLTLAPWPNRIRGGRWSTSDDDHQLAITDRRHGAAIHGLVRDVMFETRRVGPSAVRLATRIGPTAGWPFHVALDVRYAVACNALTVGYRARNLGDAVAPFALGAHPFFRVGDAGVEDLVLYGPAASMLVDDAAGIPIAREPVPAHLDVRRGVPVSELERSRCYVNLDARDGEVVWCLAAPSGEAVEVWADPVFAYWQIFAPRDFPGPAGPALAIAIEPMTAPADGFNSGEGVEWLPSGATWTAAWGIRITN